MSGLSNFGEFISNGTADKSSRAYNEVARQYNAAVDDMFASLHAENGTLKPQKQKNGEPPKPEYRKQDYERVAFTSKAEERKFIFEMKKMGVEVTPAGQKLNGQYLVEIPAEIDRYKFDTMTDGIKFAPQNVTLKEEQTDLLHALYSDDSIRKQLSPDAGAALQEAITLNEVTSFERREELEKALSSQTVQDSLNADQQLILTDILHTVHLNGKEQSDYNEQKKNEASGQKVQASDFVKTYNAMGYGNAETQKEMQQENATPEMTNRGTYTDQLAYMYLRNLDELGGVVAGVMNVGKTMEQWGGGEEKRDTQSMLNQRLDRNGEALSHSLPQSRRKTAVVLGNDTVVMNGRVVTDEKLRKQILSRHEKRQKTVHDAATRTNIRTKKQAVQKKNAEAMQMSQYKQEYHTDFKEQYTFGAAKNIVDNINTEMVALSMSSFVELNQYQIDTLTALSTNPAVKLTKEQKDLIAKLSINRGAATYKDRIDLGNLIGSIKKDIQRSGGALPEDVKNKLEAMAESVKLSEIEQGMFSTASKHLEAINKDFGKRFSATNPMKLKDLHQINSEFLKRAEKAGFQFIKVNGKFDHQMLEGLTAAQMKALGISESSRKLIGEINKKGAFQATKNKEASLTSLSGNTMSTSLPAMAASGLLKLNDDMESQQTIGELQTIKRGVQRTQKYTKNLVTTVRNAHKKGKAKQQIKKTQSEKVGKLRSSHKPPSAKAQKKKVEPKKTGKVSKVRNKAYSGKQKVQQMNQSFKSWKSGVKNKLDWKKKLANTKLGKAFTAVTKAVSAFAAKVVLIGAAAIFGISCQLAVAIVAISVIQSFANLPYKLIDNVLAPDTYEDTVAFRLYEYLGDEQDEWIASLRNFDELYNNRADLKYGINYENMSTYVGNMDNLEVDSGYFYINPFHGAVSSSDNAEYLTKVDGYDGRTIVEVSANTNSFNVRTEGNSTSASFINGKNDASIRGDYSTDNTAGGFDDYTNASLAGYSAIESGHTCNIKDIISMTDTLYQFTLDDFDDASMTSILGRSPSQINFDNFCAKVKSVFKWAGDAISAWWNGTEQPESFKDALNLSGTVSFKTIQNYATTLFECSHQQEVQLKVEYYPVADYLTGKNAGNKFVLKGGTDKTQDLTQKQASEVKLCVSPVTSSFKVAITSNGKVEPFVEKGSNKYFLNENNGFDITVSTEDNMTSDDMRNLCLWSNMDGDEVTYKKIKQHIDNVRDACWTTDDGKKSGVRLGNQTGLYTETYINKSNSWFDSVDAAEKDIVTSMIVYREHFNLPADEYTIYWNGNTPYQFTRDYAKKVSTTPTAGQLRKKVVKDGFHEETRDCYFAGTKATWYSGADRELCGTRDSNGYFKITELGNNYDINNAISPDRVNYNWSNETAEKNKANTAKHTQAYVYVPLLPEFSNYTLEQWYSIMNGRTISEIQDVFTSNGMSVYGFVSGKFLTNNGYDFYNYPPNPLGDYASSNFQTALEMYLGQLGLQAGSDEYNKLKGCQWIKVPAKKSGVEITDYKYQYRYKDGTVDIYQDYRETLNRSCQGHEYSYCGGHICVHSQGVVFSATNEQMAMTGIYSTKSSETRADDFVLKDNGYGAIKGKYDRSKFDYSTALTYSQSGGCESPLEDPQGSVTGMEGVNLIISGTEWAEGTDGIDASSISSRAHMLRDIFDVDCGIKKGRYLFPIKSGKPTTKAFLQQYEGWTEDNMVLALHRMAMDWNDCYGFDVPLELNMTKSWKDRSNNENINPLTALSDTDVKNIMDALKTKYGASFTQERQDTVEYALRWVGRGHYSEMHTGHGFLSTADKGRSVSVSVAGETKTVQYSASCTAGNSEDFARFIYFKAGKVNRTGSSLSNEVSTKYGWQVMTSRDSLLPADLLRHGMTKGYGWVQESVLNAAEEGDGWSGSFISAMNRFKDESYVIYLGELDEDIKLQCGRTLQAGVPLCIDLTTYNGKGNIYLHGESNHNALTTKAGKTYTWLMNIDRPADQGKVYKAKISFH